MLGFQGCYKKPAGKPCDFFGNIISTFCVFLSLIIVLLSLSCKNHKKSSEIYEYAPSSKMSIDYIKKLGLPVLEIKTVNYVEPTCDYIYPPFGGRGAGIANNKYVEGRLRIFRDGDVVYDSGEYNKDKKSGIRIKIRGNASAYGEKKPYKIKLNEKADLLFRKDTLDNTFAETDWVLIKDANSTNTIVGVKTAHLCGISWTPDFRFVNVFMNGDFRGIYLLGDSVERSERRCNVADDGFVIENDSYWWKEKNYFQTEKGCKYTFKYPDKDEVTPEQIEYIKNFVQKVETTLASSYNYLRLIDEDSFVAWLLTHDILGSWDHLGSNFCPCRALRLKNVKGDAINESRVLDALRWGTETTTTIEDDIEFVEEWFTTRFEWLNKAAAAW